MILITGDFCPYYRVEHLIENKQYDKIFSDVLPIIRSADYSITNFETCVASTNINPIHKCGPNLRCGINAIEALKWAGFDCITLANNHFRDYGDLGVAETLNTCKSCSLDYVGGGNNIEEAQKTLIKKLNGRDFAFINICEHEFSIATETEGGSNPLNPIAQFYEINKVKDIVDYVIVIIHGGHEHFQLPSPRMQETYRFFIDSGADIIVNHHQHCYSGYEIYKGKPIFYGIGNFCFDHYTKRNSIWNEGYMVNLNFENGVSFDIIPYIQCNDNPLIQLMKGEKFNHFLTKLNELNSIIINPQRLKQEYYNWVNQNDIDYKVAVTPWQYRYLVSAFVRNLLPTLVSRKRYRLLYNFIACESHRDRLLNMLRTKIYK